MMRPRRSTRKAGRRRSPISASCHSPSERAVSGYTLNHRTAKADLSTNPGSQGPEFGITSDDELDLTQIALRDCTTHTPFDFHIPVDSQTNSPTKANDDNPRRGVLTIARQILASCRVKAS